LNALIVGKTRYEHAIVETASRSARDLMAQEVGFAALGIKLVAADRPQSFLDDTPKSKLIRQNPWRCL
jgi:hypothetical protein